jgi:hypothetical protein
MSLDAEPVLRRALGLHQVLPSQIAGPARTSAGLRKFYAAILTVALDDAGIARRSGTGPLPPRATPYARVQARHRATARALAQRWLTGELEAEVAVPLAVACDALGLNAEAVADAVRRSAVTSRRQHERRTTPNDASDADADATQCDPARRPGARHRAHQRDEQEAGSGQASAAAT